MNFNGYTAQTVPRFGSLVQSDDVTELPFGVADDVQNCSYRGQSVGPRDGIACKLQFGASGSSIGGLGVLRYLAADNSGVENIQIVAHTQQDGNVWAAGPFTQSSVTQLTTADMMAAAGLEPAKYMGLFPQISQAYNKMILAAGDLMTGKAQPLIINGETLTCDPVSDKPVGDSWAPAIRYRVGHIVSPTSGIGNLYQCTVAGLSGNAEPVWPTTAGQSVVDGDGVGNVTWVMLNILCGSGLPEPGAPVVLSSSAANAFLPAGATLFLACTWVNSNGESDATVVNPDGTAGAIAQYKNAGATAVSITVALPSPPANVTALATQYQPSAVNVYGYVATGTPNSALYLDPTAYAFMGTGSPGAQLLLSALPTGAAIPQTNTAYITPAGNIASGVRYMIVLFMTRTGYICGFSGPAPIECTVSVDGRMLLVQNLPKGPYNCVARICAFTVAGQGSAGPFFYIGEDDYVDPGSGEAKILQTATLIPDNTTEAAYFDFLDTYIDGTNDVTNYFDRIEVPPCADVYYSKNLDRVIYGGGLIGYPSGFLISDEEDEEAVRVPGSVVQVAQTDGDRAVCCRDHGTTVIAYKENSATSLVPNDGDPSDWDDQLLWSTCGPCGPRAIDCAASDGQNIHAFAHRTGGYVYTGGNSPQWVTKELQGTVEEPGVWDRINWSCSHLIRTTINAKAREVYFFVPLDGQTANSARITVNYVNGWDDPIVFVVRSGREVPNLTGRKWSLDSIAANDCLYLPQRTAAAAIN